MEYRIGDFSIITRLPVKTLRYYHEIGLLEPCRVDAENGYRWYDEAALRRAATIGLLKDLEFSLEEIKEVLTRAKDDADLAALVRGKMAELERRIAHYRTVRNQLAVLLNENGAPGAKGETDMKQIDESAGFTALEETRVASIRFKGRYDQIGPYFGRLFKLYGRFAAGAPLALYHDPEFKAEDADIEACVPLRAGASVTAREGAEIKVLPAVKAVQLAYRGGYDGIGQGYERAFAFLAAQGAAAAVPSREVYLKGPGMILPRSPKKFLTLIQIPVV
jgi:DNA-binding transcriptional MerR regulator